jgi:hypothetical protein
MVHLDRLAPYQGTTLEDVALRQEQLESNHWEPSHTEGRQGRSQPSEKKKWWYACTLVGMTSLKVTVLWHVDPLLGNDRKIRNYTTATAK